MKKLQSIVKEFCDEYDMNCSVENRFLDVSSELGELGKEILKSTEYGNRDFNATEALRLETGDLFFSLLALANECGIDMEQAVLDVLEKYKHRLQKGSAGSEND